jgi:hypothetical protein
MQVIHADAHEFCDSGIGLKRKVLRKRRYVQSRIAFIEQGPQRFIQKPGTNHRDHTKLGEAGDQAFDSRSSMRMMNIHEIALFTRCPRRNARGAQAVTGRHYWGLFCIAMAMALHSIVVGRFLGSSFFMLLFFWGWVAAAAYRGQLEAARAMAISMVVLLVGVAVVLALRPAEFQNELAYYTFALYPALVSWICVFFYVRYLLQKDERNVTPSQHGAPQRHSV